MFASTALQGTHGAVIPTIRANWKKAGAGERRRISASRPRVCGIGNNKLGAQKTPRLPGAFSQLSDADVGRNPNRAYAAALAAEPSTTCGAVVLVVAIGMLRGFL